jgi:hypothetical protein
MARPQKNTVDYFPFYVEEGKKMFYIEETYGNEGFAVFVKLLRELARTEYHYLDLSQKATKMFLAAKCKVSIEFLEKLIIDLVELGKFNRQLWEENSIVWCQDFVDGIQDAYEKRKNKCITLQGLFSLLVSLGVRKQSKLPIKGGENTQTILKETKEEKTNSNYFFDEESKTPNQLYEMKLDNYIYDNPKNKNQADYTKDELELIINNKKKSLAIWCEIHSLSDRNEKQKIEFIQALNKQLYLLGFNGFCDFLRQLKHYFLTQKRENYKYIVKLPKLIDTVNEKDWKVYWTKTATEEELDPEPYLPPQPDVDLDSQEFKDWEKEASVHGEWRKRQAAKMFKAGL